MPDSKHKDKARPVYQEPGPLLSEALLFGLCEEKLELIGVLDLIYYS
jgi:hypothetical protein